jgi:hypothetical protein
LVTAGRQRKNSDVAPKGFPGGLHSEIGAVVSHA